LRVARAGLFVCTPRKHFGEKPPIRAFARKHFANTRPLQCRQLNTKKGSNSHNQHNRFRKGETIMTKFYIQYVRYALSAFASVAFGLAIN
jgi:hypothetical protein